MALEESEPKKGVFWNGAGTEATGGVTGITGTGPADL